MSNPSIKLRAGASGPTFGPSTPGHVLAIDSDGVSVKPVPPSGGEGSSYIVRADLADLVARDSSSLVDGCVAYVVSEGENYQLDTRDPLTLFEALIVERGAGAGAGRWYRRTRAYVVGNFTLWCQAYQLGICGFTPGQLLASHDNEPDIILDLSSQLDGTENQVGVCADALGNVWMFNGIQGWIKLRASKVLAADTLRSGTPALPVVLDVDPFIFDSEAGGGIFDARNGLWIMNGQHGTFGRASFVRYGQREAASSAGKPSLQLQAPEIDDFDGTSNMQDAVFDGAGNLWCTVAFSANQTGSPGPGFNGGIAMWTAGQVDAGGVQTPTKWWRGSNLSGPGLAGTSQMCVAPNGLLWVTNVSDNNPQPGDNNIRVWDMSEPSGNPAPALVFTCAEWSYPYGIALDDAGRLIVVDGFENKVLIFNASQLGASGELVPDVVLTPSVGLYSKITFSKNPDRTGLLPSGFP